MKFSSQLCNDLAGFLFDWRYVGCSALFDSLIKQAHASCASDGIQKHQCLIRVTRAGIQTRKHMIHSRHAVIYQWACPVLFVFIFVLFTHKFYRKNCRRQRDSNSDRRSWRRARWPLDHTKAQIIKQSYHLLLSSFNSSKCFDFVVTVG